jgi:hypothetical protein
VECTTGPSGRPCLHMALGGGTAFTPAEHVSAPLGHWRTCCSTVPRADASVGLPRRLERGETGSGDGLAWNSALPRAGQGIRHLGSRSIGCGTSPGLLGNYRSTIEPIGNHETCADPRTLSWQPCFWRRRRAMRPATSSPSHEQAQVSSGEDALHIAVREDYCWMWRNSSPSQARVDVSLRN